MAYVILRIKPNDPDPDYWNDIYACWMYEKRNATICTQEWAATIIRKNELREGNPGDLIQIEALKQHV